MGAFSVAALVGAVAPFPVAAADVVPPGPALVAAGLDATALVATAFVAAPFVAAPLIAERFVGAALVAAALLAGAFPGLGEGAPFEVALLAAVDPAVADESALDEAALDGPALDGPALDGPALVAAAPTGLAAAVDAAFLTGAFTPAAVTGAFTPAAVTGAFTPAAVTGAVAFADFPRAALAAGERGAVLWSAPVSAVLDCPASTASAPGRVVELRVEVAGDTGGSSRPVTSSPTRRSARPIRAASAATPSPFRRGDMRRGLDVPAREVGKYTRRHAGSPLTTPSAGYDDQATTRTSSRDHQTEATRGRWKPGAWPAREITSEYRKNGPVGASVEPDPNEWACRVARQRGWYRGAGRPASSLGRTASRGAP